MKTMKFFDPYFGHELDVAPRVRMYQNGSLRLDLVEVDEYGEMPYATLTVYAPEYNLYCGWSIVKAYSENWWVPDFLDKSGFANIDIHTENDDYPRYVFDLTALSEFDPDGVIKYINENIKRNKPKKKYTVRIEEKTYYEFEVEADNEEQAIDKAFTSDDWESARYDSETMNVECTEKENENE